MSGKNKKISLKSIVQKLNKEGDKMPFFNKRQDDRAQVVFVQ